MSLLFGTSLSFLIALIGWLSAGDSTKLSATLFGAYQLGAVFTCDHMLRIDSVANCAVFKLLRQRADNCLPDLAPSLSGLAAPVPQLARLGRRGVVADHLPALPRQRARLPVGHLGAGRPDARLVLPLDVLLVSSVIRCCASTHGGWCRCFRGRFRRTASPEEICALFILQTVKPDQLQNMRRRRSELRHAANQLQDDEKAPDKRPIAPDAAPGAVVIHIEAPHTAGRTGADVRRAIEDQGSLLSAASEPSMASQSAAAVVKPGMTAEPSVAEPSDAAARSALHSMPASAAASVLHADTSAVGTNTAAASQLSFALASSLPSPQPPAAGILGLPPFAPS